MAQFVDWDLAAATAGALGKSGPRVSVDEATRVVSELRRLAVDWWVLVKAEWLDQDPFRR